MKTSRKTPIFILATSLLSISLLGTSAAYAVSDRYRDLSARLTSNAEQELLQGKADAADDMLNLALTADPGNARAYVLKGQAQGKLDNKEEALRLISVGLEIEPGNETALKLQGEAALALGEIEQAETALSRLRTVCKAPCAAANDLAVAIEADRATQEAQEAQ
jgi:tetratricopeptide (TPR) repeat protein